MNWTPEKIRETRKGLGLTIHQLCDKVSHSTGQKMHYTTWRYWETGKINLRAPQQVFLTEIIDVATTNVYDAVRDGDADYTKFSLRTRGGWSDKLAISGNVNATVTVVLPDNGRGDYAVEGTQN